MSDELMKQALELVNRWEHGDEPHREWLRNIAVTDIVAMLVPLHARIVELEAENVRLREVLIKSQAETWELMVGEDPILGTLKE